jgi:hypothetical protein
MFMKRCMVIQKKTTDHQFDLMEYSIRWQKKIMLLSNASSKKQLVGSFVVHILPNVFIKINLLYKRQYIKVRSSFIRA